MQLVILTILYPLSQNPEYAGAQLKRASSASSTEAVEGREVSRGKQLPPTTTTEDTTAAPSSADSSIGFEDLQAPLLATSPRRRSLATRLRRLGRFSLSSTTTEAGSSPEKAASTLVSTPALPKPSKGILRRRKVHCSKREPTTSFGTESSTEEGSPERRGRASPGRFCKRALGRVFGFGSSSADHAVPAPCSETAEEQEEEERKVVKSVSIEEPERSPSQRRGDHGWRQRRKAKKPPLVFGGTFPIDEPVGSPAMRSALGRAAADSLNVATFPVDAFCCALPNLCEEHRRRASGAVMCSASITSPSKCDTGNGKAAPGEDVRAGPSPRQVRDVRPKSASAAMASGGSQKQKGWLRFLGSDVKLHKS